VLHRSILLVGAIPPKDERHWVESTARAIFLKGRPEQPRRGLQHEIPNIPGKSLVAVIVNHAPGAKSRPHRHAGSAFVGAYVLSGTVPQLGR
jgi:quercetin dioxygenase-like cupin family protein